MDGCDHTLLAALALGDASPAEAYTAGCHLGHCAACRTELAELQELVATARTASPGGDAVRPPGRVWQAVADAVTAEGDGTDAPDGTGPVRER
ncbi:hypothetical protein CUT44_11470 [Streptomyces carminius]|uniref:Zinc-finger domain-containing protein n=1 Tax=Streptomyces carminius TaxID=2665496 RepID=A0A2M8LYH3_9ACTN|nr:hypothetical protein [Streptomyces carminius]PJE97027.1 hypothetical protein CUT44_14725 [Streptomyces carminius]PJE97736.1 hypothetical protein CUT44_11470 [Streptomyces carminius]